MPSRTPMRTLMISTKSNIKFVKTQHTRDDLCVREIWDSVDGARELNQAYNATANQE